MESLDAQIMAFADALASVGSSDDADALRAYAATIREVVRGAHSEGSLGETLQGFADAADAAAKVVQDHTPPPWAP
ncbi:hypothetical protein ACWD2L_05970 [Streptomyces sp. NPDC002754]